MFDSMQKGSQHLVYEFDAVYGKGQLQISIEGTNFDNIP